MLPVEPGGEYVCVVGLRGGRYVNLLADEEGEELVGDVGAAERVRREGEVLKV